MSPKIRRVTGAALTLALVGGVFSLLIWGKLRLVGGVPRSAYAEPGHPAELPANPDTVKTKRDAVGNEVPETEQSDGPTSR